MVCHLQLLPKQHLPHHLSVVEVNAASLERAGYFPRETYFLRKPGSSAIMEAAKSILKHVAMHVSLSEQAYRKGFSLSGSGLIIHPE
ncbi:hypothetical protein TNCV_3922951 [Trichonephila clavipes]|nr:hypothetical protein TNCV_3922951 [Trichonephila clavipes]